MQGESCDVFVDIPTPVPTGLGPEGNSFLFDGDSTFVATDALIPTTGDFTVSLWAKETINDPNNANLIGQGANFFLGHREIDPLSGDRLIRIGNSWSTGVPFPEDQLWHLSLIHI